jgi:hypothetical protein
MHHLQLQAADIQNIPILDGLIHFNGTIPIFPDDLRIGKAKAFRVKRRSQKKQ